MWLIRLECETEIWWKKMEMVFSGHRVSATSDAFVCAGRKWIIHDGQFSAEAYYLIPVSDEYMLPVAGSLYSDRFEYAAAAIIKQGEDYYCRDGSDKLFTILNQEVIDPNTDPFDLKVSRPESVLQSRDDLSTIIICQMFAVALKCGEWWLPSDEAVTTPANKDRWSMMGWDPLLRFERVFDMPVAGCIDRLLSRDEEYTAFRYRDFSTGRDYVEALEAAGLPASAINTIFDKKRIGFLNCDLDGADFRSYYRK